MFQRLFAAGLAAVLVALSGCGGGGATPEATVRTFFDAVKKGDAGKQEWMSCFTDKVRTFFEKMEKMSGKSQTKMMDTIARYEIKNTTTEGDTARVAVATTEVRAGKEVTQEGWIGLKRDGGSWKIFQLAKAGEEPVNLEEQAAKTEAMFEMMKKEQKGLEPGVEEGGEKPALPTPPAMTPEMQQKMKESMEKMKKSMEKAKVDLEKSKTDAEMPKETQDAMKKLLEGVK
jgi:hypothetical protein